MRARICHHRRRGHHDLSLSYYCSSDLPAQLARLNWLSATELSITQLLKHAHNTVEQFWAQFLTWGYGHTAVVRFVGRLLGRHPRFRSLWFEKKGSPITDA